MRDTSAWCSANPVLRRKPNSRHHSKSGTVIFGVQKDSVCFLNRQARILANGMCGSGWMQTLQYEHFGRITQLSFGFMLIACYFLVPEGLKQTFYNGISFGKQSPVVNLAVIQYVSRQHAHIVDGFVISYLRSQISYRCKRCGYGIRRGLSLMFKVMLIFAFLNVL